MWRQFNFPRKWRSTLGQVWGLVGGRLSFFLLIWSIKGESGGIWKDLGLWGWTLYWSAGLWVMQCLNDKNMCRLTSFSLTLQDFLGQAHCTLGEVVGSLGSRSEKPLGWVGAQIAVAEKGVETSQWVSDQKSHELQGYIHSLQILVRPDDSGIGPDSQKHHKDVFIREKWRNDIFSLKFWLFKLDEREQIFVSLHIILPWANLLIF